MWSAPAGIKQITLRNFGASLLNLTFRTRIRLFKHCLRLVMYLIGQTIIHRNTSSIATLLVNHAESTNQLFKSKYFWGTLANARNWMNASGLIVDMETLWYLTVSRGEFVLPRISILVPVQRHVWGDREYIRSVRLMLAHIEMFDHRVVLVRVVARKFGLHSFDRLLYIGICNTIDRSMLYINLQHSWKRKNDPKSSHWWSYLNFATLVRSFPFSNDQAITRQSHPFTCLKEYAVLEIDQGRPKATK